MLFASMTHSSLLSGSLPSTRSSLLMSSGMDMALRAFTSPPAVLTRTSLLIEPSAPATPSQDSAVSMLLSSMPYDEFI